LFSEAPARAPLFLPAILGHAQAGLL